MEVICTSETLAYSQKATRRNNPSDQYLWPSTLPTAAFFIVRHKNAPQNGEKEGREETGIFMVSSA
jgi:hypothetical protein